MSYHVKYIIQNDVTSLNDCSPTLRTQIYQFLLNPLYGFSFLENNFEWFQRCQHFAFLV